MQLSLDTGSSHYRITAYSTSTITINQETYAYSLIVSPSQLIEPWAPRSIIGLSFTDLQQIAQLQADVILLGTGAQLIFPKQELLNECASANIHLEIMDTGAACRTFNVLMAEGRHVAAGLIVNQPHETKTL